MITFGRYRRKMCERDTERPSMTFSFQLGAKCLQVCIVVVVVAFVNVNKGGVGHKPRAL